MASEVEHFLCVGRDALGRRQQLTLSAKNQNAAAKALRVRGLLPIEIRAAEAQPVTGASSTPSPLTSNARISRQALAERKVAMMVARLATLLEHGVTAERALGIIAHDRDRVLAQSAEAIRSALREGARLSDAMRDAGRVADPMTLALTAAGDASGALAPCLREADRLLTGRARVMRSLTSGMIYPVVLAIVAFVAITLVMLVIIPQFRPLVADRLEIVPLLGQAVFAFSASLSSAAPWLGAIAVSLIAILVWRIKQIGAESLMERAIEMIPGISASMAEARISLALRIIGTLLLRNVPLDIALKVAINSGTDARLKASLGAASDQILRGVAVADAFAASGVAPPSTLELVRIGGETGDLASMLQRAADDLEETSDTRMQRILVLAEPVMITTIGLFIGVSLYALFSAITAVNAINF